jgi:S-adenosylmethionine synthetase
MERVITVGGIKQTPIEERKVEIVERKGRGHPDYIADGSSEAVSRALCAYYKERFGQVLHHNVDKGLVVGGSANPRFGNGEVTEPIRVIVAGRAVTELYKENEVTSIPIGTIALRAIKEFLNHNFRFLDVEHHVVCNYMIKKSDVTLVETFNAGVLVPLANDTSFGVGYAPFSQTEELVMQTENYLNSDKVKQELPEIGEDIKVMGLRKNDQLHLTVAAPMISGLTPDLDHYLSVKEDICDRSIDLAARVTEYPVEVAINTADMPEKKIVYLTVTGTSAEQGDDGNTGRGNRAHGLITPCRPMSLEATAGKNPINHVGKIYNVLAFNAADKIYQEVHGIREVYVKILSQIGKPIDQPLATDVELLLDRDVKIRSVKDEIEGIVDETLNNIFRVSDGIIEGTTALF